MAETKIFGVTINTDALNSLKNIPETYKIIAGSVVSVLILAGGLYYFSYPIYDHEEEPRGYKQLVEDNQKLADEISGLETKLGYNSMTKRYRKIEEVEKQIKDLEEEILKLQSRIPDKENIASMIYDLENITENSNNSDLFDIVPAGMSKVALPPSLNTGKTNLNLMQVPFTLTLESNYPQLISLFKDFERYQRAISTASLSLSPVTDPKEKFSALKVNLNLRAYVLPPEGGN